MPVGPMGYPLTQRVLSSLRVTRCVHSFERHYSTRCGPEATDERDYQQNRNGQLTVPKRPSNNANPDKQTDNWCRKDTLPGPNSGDQE
jgi:hypothetical protein